MSIKVPKLEETIYSNTGINDKNKKVTAFFQTERIYLQFFYLEALLDA